MSTAVDRTTLTERVADGILELIIARSLTAGDPLPSGAELAKQFDVSIIVVREALARLAGQGILNRRQGREAVVALPGSEVLSSTLSMWARNGQIPLNEFLHCRAALETHAAGLASARGDRHARETALLPALERMAKAKRQSDFNAADLDFHAIVADLSGNQALLIILTSLQAVIRTELYKRTRGQNARSPSATLEDHRQVAEAIIAGDRTAATEAMARHFRVTLPDFRP
jgi:GntR family transcriptional repressor for pyruvate dehydrogenase complex